MKTVAERWMIFEACVISVSAPAVQRTEMRRSFYAGFHEALLACFEMADESGANDDAGIAMIQRLHDECGRFALDVQAGKA